MHSGRSREGGGAPVVLLSSGITRAVVFLTPGEVAGLTGMLVATSVFFPGQGALLQDAVSIGAAPILQISCAVTDAQRESRSSGPATSSLIAGRPACCHVVPVYMAVDTSEAHTPSGCLMYPPIASRMAKFDSSWLFSRNRFHPVRTSGQTRARGS